MTAAAARARAESIMRRMSVKRDAGMSSVILLGMEESAGRRAPAVATLPESQQRRNPAGRSQFSPHRGENPAIFPPKPSPPHRANCGCAQLNFGVAREEATLQSPGPDRRTSRPACVAMPNEPTHRHDVARARNTGAPRRWRQRFSIAAVGALSSLGGVPRPRGRRLCPEMKGNIALTMFPFTSRDRVRRPRRGGMPSRRSLAVPGFDEPRSRVDTYQHQRKIAP